MDARQISKDEIKTRNGQIIELTSGDAAIIIRNIGAEYLVGIIDPDFSDFNIGEYLAG